MTTVQSEGLSQRHMTQVLKHDYGKSRISSAEIRAAIKAVRKAKSAPVDSNKKALRTDMPKVLRKAIRQEA